jgi:SAM-dependent methyltransferase
MDIAEYNRQAWDQQVEQGNPWTLPVTSEQVAAARAGDWQVVLTPTIAVPRAWFGDVRGKEILLLASGGGQQGPILAAAGARVTVFDNSPRQLERDRSVAERDGLEIATLQGDMRDLSALSSERFDLIFHPVSNCFVDDIHAVWREAFRVLRHGGALLAGFANPIMYTFDYPLSRQGIYQVRHAIPNSDQEIFTEEQREQFFGAHTPLEWSHTLSDQIGGQLAAGFLLAGFYEDIDPGEKIAEYLPTFIATRAVKI